MKKDTTIDAEWYKDRYLIKVVNITHEGIHGLFRVWKNEKWGELFKTGTFTWDKCKSLRTVDNQDHLFKSREVPLTGSYTAIIEDETTTVGCVIVSNEKVLEVAKIIQDMKKEECV